MAVREEGESPPDTRRDRLSAPFLVLHCWCCWRALPISNGDERERLLAALPRDDKEPGPQLGEAINRKTAS
jgi:hypothetical protein